MKVTVGNVLRFWKKLMFPEASSEYHLDRLRLRMDMPWEPWLHCSVWIGMILILVNGELKVVPPINGLDWPWIVGGLLSPVVGFASVWTLAFKSGRARYVAIWTRMVSDIGLASTIILYQVDRAAIHGWEAIGWGEAVLPNIVLNFAAWFTLALVWRDIRFIIATEKLAASIYANVRTLSLDEWADRVDDAN